MQFTEEWFLEVVKLYPDNPEVHARLHSSMKRVLKASYLPENKWRPIRMFAGDDLQQFRTLNDIKRNIVTWVRDGNTLYIYSSQYGNGKTSWAVKIMLAYLAYTAMYTFDEVRAVFVSCADFLRLSTDFTQSGKAYFAKLQRDIVNSDLVVWDDIASTKVTEHGHSQLMALIDNRIFAEKANIFTGNSTEDELEAIMGGRIFSRIWNGGTTIQLHGNDRRRSNNGRTSNTFQNS